MLRATWRGLETWHGRDTSANWRASPRPYGRKSRRSLTAHGRGTSLEVLTCNHQWLKRSVHVYAKPTSGYEKGNAMGWRGGLGCDCLRMRAYPTPGGRNARWHTHDAQQGR